MIEREREREREIWERGKGDDTRHTGMHWDTDVDRNKREGEIWRELNRRYFGFRQTVYV